MTTKELLQQPSTIFGIVQVLIGLVMVYTNHQDIGGGLITAGFGFIIYQGNKK